MSERHGRGLRFAVDTGGTFTDLIIVWPDNRLTMHKATTTPNDPARGILNCFEVAASGFGMSSRELLAQGDVLIHGTTHPINAILTGTTAKTAFLTTEGHPDTLVFREGGRIEPFNFTVDFPEPYIPKALTYEVPERVLSTGAVQRELDEARVAEILMDLKQKQVEAISVCLLWSVANPAHEIRLGELITVALPGVPFSLSHQVNPSIREYRRAVSTCIDASLRPIVSNYMSALETTLAEGGFKGRVLIGTSLGGVIEASDAAQSAVKLINSGPSMAPVAARAYCGETDTLIVGDTGGTTFDVSLVRHGRIPRTRESWLGRPYRSHMTGMPSVDVKSVGAGGGSIAWCDSGGLLHVGPQSAGSVPGPVCYGRGGTSPTVTDAALVLGLIDGEFFLDGTMPLNRTAAVAAIDEFVASPLGCTTEEAASAIIELATEHMVQAILDITVNQGIDPAGAVFVAGGGAAGINGVTIARRLGCSKVVFPESGAALSAVGGAISELSSFHQAVHYTHSDAFDYDGVNAILEGLGSSSVSFLGKGQGLGADKYIWSVEARYPDQAWEIEVPLDHGRIRDAANVEDLVRNFHATHDSLFATSDKNSGVEMVGWSLEVRRPIGDGKPGRLSVSHHAGGSVQRQIWFAGQGWLSARVIRAGHDMPLRSITGPAIVESGFASIVIDPGSYGRFDESGTLIVETAISEQEANNVVSLR